MDFLVLANLVVTIANYLIVAFFLVAIIRTFLKSENPQDAVVYSLMMVPFILRILRLK